MPDVIPRSILSTVLDHCTPAIRGEDDDFHDLLSMYTAPPCVYKRRRRALSWGVGPSGRTQHSALLTEHIRSSEPRYWHSPQSTPPLAETWELPSLSRLACTPYYRHPRCKTVQCSRTPLCWTYAPLPPGRNEDKPVGDCVASCINHLGRGTRSIITSWIRTAGSGHRHYLSFSGINSFDSRL